MGLGGGDGASFFYLLRIQFFYGRGWGTVSDFFKKKEFKFKDFFFRGKGVGDATVSDFFYKESKSKR